VRCKVVKNKVAPPFRQAEFDIMFTGDMHGINHWGDVLDLATEYEVVKKSGAFYSYGDQRLGQGRMAVVGYLREHEEIGAEIEQKVRDLAGVMQRGSSAAAADPDDVAEPAELSIDA
jgi:recombination protein RecA